MANSIQKDVNGPDWPLGFIAVPTPGSPVSIMSLVDPTGVNDPSKPTSQFTAEYSPRAYQIQFQAMKPTDSGMTYNVGFAYVMRMPTKGGSGGKSDTGSIVAVLPSGSTYFLDAAPINKNVWSPYRYYVDADMAGEGLLCTLIIQ